MSLRSVPLTVDEEDEDVMDSRTAARPRASTSTSSCLNFHLVTGGRLRVGLDCLGFKGNFGGRDLEGEYEDMEVGVDVWLMEPGLSERRVEDPLLWAKLGVGGGRFCINEVFGVLWF